MSDRRNTAPKKCSKTELTLQDNKHIFFTCVNNIQDDKFKLGFWKKLTSNMEVKPRTCREHWEKLRQKYESEFGPIENINKLTMMTDIPDEFFATNKKKCGQNSRQCYPEAIAEALKMCDKTSRQTQRATAEAIDVPKSTFARQMKHEGAARKVNSAVRPALSELHHYKRILFCLRQTQHRRDLRMGLRCADDYYDVHVDEKWFMKTKVKATYYMAPDEEEPERQVSHKSHIDKIMFLSAVARPRCLPDGTYWDGKIGIWPIGEYTEALRNSNKRCKGTLVWKNLSVDGDMCRQLMMDCVVPAICARWPKSEWSDPRVIIRIQQDGAPGHINYEGKQSILSEETDKFDVEWMAYLEQMGLEGKIEMFDQPPQSPDLNINDLGLFNAIQSVYEKLPPKSSMEDIIAHCEQAHWECPSRKVNHLFLTRQSVMNEIFKYGGGNGFKIPHMGKEKLEREGKLPRVLEVAEEAREWLWLLDHSKLEQQDLMTICTPKKEIRKPEAEAQKPPEAPGIEVLPPFHPLDNAGPTAMQ